MADEQQAPKDGEKKQEVNAPQSAQAPAQPQAPSSVQPAASPQGAPVEASAPQQPPAQPPVEAAAPKPAEIVPSAPEAASEKRVLGRGLDALIPPSAQGGVIGEAAVKSDSGAADEDIKRVLVVLDDLLGKLPDRAIEEFSRSKDFELYDKVLKKYGV